jgi:hypothetical protein
MIGHVDTCLSLNGCQYRAVWTTNTKALLVVIKKVILLLNFCLNFNLMFKWQILYTAVTNLLQFTTDFRKFLRYSQCPLQLVGEGRVFFVWVDLHVFHAVSGIPIANNSSLVSTFFFVNLTLHPTPLYTHTHTHIYIYIYIYIYIHTYIHIHTRGGKQKFPELNFFSPTNAPFY